MRACSRSVLLAALVSAVASSADGQTPSGRPSAPQGEAAPGLYSPAQAQLAAQQEQIDQLTKTVQSLAEKLEQPGRAAAPPFSATQAPPNLASKAEAPTGSLPAVDLQALQQT